MVSALVFHHTVVRSYDGAAERNQMIQAYQLCPTTLQAAANFSVYIQSNNSPYYFQPPLKISNYKMSMPIFSPLILYQPTLVFKRTDPSGSDLVLLRPLLLLCIIHRIQSQIPNFHLFIIEKREKVSQNSCFCTISRAKGQIKSE